MACLLDTTDIRVVAKAAQRAADATGEGMTIWRHVGGKIPLMRRGVNRVAGRGTHIVRLESAGNPKHCVWENMGTMRPASAPDEPEAVTPFLLVPRGDDFVAPYPDLPVAPDPVDPENQVPPLLPHPPGPPLL